VPPEEDSAASIGAPVHGEQEQPMNDKRVAWRGVARHRRFEATVTHRSRVK
jgi:hypothetical protein